MSIKYRLDPKLVRQVWDTRTVWWCVREDLFVPKFPPHLKTLHLLSLSLRIVSLDQKGPSRLSYSFSLPFFCKLLTVPDPHSPSPHSRLHLSSDLLNPTPIYRFSDLTVRSLNPKTRRPFPPSFGKPVPGPLSPQNLSSTPHPDRPFLRVVTSCLGVWSVDLLLESIGV